MSTHERGSIAMALRLIEVRLRFVAVLAIAALAVAKWDAVAQRIDRWLHPPAVRPLAGAEVWSCPMDPEVVRTSAGTCPACGMPLSLRGSGPAAARAALSPARIALAGIATTPVATARLERVLRVAGTVEIDERRRVDVPARVRGRIDSVTGAVAGTEVKAGDELATLYSPDLVNAQQVYLQLLEAQSAGPDGPAIAGEVAHQQRMRPLLLGVSELDLQELERTRKVKTQVPVRAPCDGTVIESAAIVGAYVDDGMPLVRLADLASVRIEARVFAGDAATIAVGDAMEVRAPGIAGSIAASVAWIAPVVDPATRTVEVRADVANEQRRLKPGMPVDVALRSAEEALAVPASAVIDAGSRRLVYVEREPGVFDAVEVELGARAGDAFPVVAGLTAGDRVVAQGAFLVDAETRLRPASGPAGR